MVDSVYRIGIKVQETALIHKNCTVSTKHDGLKRVYFSMRLLAIWTPDVTHNHSLKLKGTSLTPPALHCVKISGLWMDARNTGSSSKIFHIARAYCTATIGISRKHNYIAGEVPVYVNLTTPRLDLALLTIWYVRQMVHESHCYCRIVRYQLIRHDLLQVGGAPNRFIKWIQLADISSTGHMGTHGYIWVHMLQLEICDFRMRLVDPL